MTATPQTEPSLVFVVDDDRSMREATTALLEAVGLRVRAFASAEEFLARPPVDAACCVVLDVRLPGVSGLNIQEELARAGAKLPIVFVTAHGDIPMSVRAMKAGAVEFLTKPFRDQDLIDAVQLALKNEHARRERSRSSAALRERFASLSAREREVMDLVAEGLMNKQIAGRLGVAEITVKIHRGHVMQKMAARSLAELVKMSQSLADAAG